MSRHALICVESRSIRPKGIGSFLGSVPPVPSPGRMPETKRRLTEAGVRDLADDDGPIFSTVAKLVDALQRAVPHSRDLELRDEALRLGRELLRGTKYEDEEDEYDR
jgi:hypothetical protein